MTAAELRDYVQKKFREGQEIDISIQEGSGQKRKVSRVIIDKFYPNHVSVIHKGNRESFTYLELYKNAKAVMGKPNKALIESLRFGKINQQTTDSSPSPISGQPVHT